MRKILLVILGITFLSNCSSLKENELSKHISDWRVKNGIQGVSVSIYNKNKVTTIVSGSRSAKNDSLEKNDSFMIGSVSKTFTAAAILQLVEKGTIKLDDSAREASGLHLPIEITVAHLLYHEAGLAEYMGGALSFETFLKQHAKGRNSWTSEEIRNYSVQVQPNKNPIFAYSNSHFIVLGAIVEKQYGMPLKDALKNFVFEPANLHSAKLVKTKEDDPDALGYSKGIKEAIGTSQIGARLTRELATAGEAAGGIAMNSSDLAKWATLYFSGKFVPNLTFKGPKGGKAFGLTSKQIKVGPGAYEVRYNKQIVRLHGGDGLGNTALAVYDPETNKSIAILVNDDKIHSLGFGNPEYLDALAIELLKMY
tara:strand:+ start:26500 stop:27600 length:1101 start_codon:yes stop_codon:yes gene_type:complete